MLKFKPALSECFIVTTAPDDGETHKPARVITAELGANGHQMLVYIWNWNTLEEKISADGAARKAFDPGFGPFTRANVVERCFCRLKDFRRIAPLRQARQKFLLGNLLRRYAVLPAVS